MVSRRPVTPDGAWGAPAARRLASRHRDARTPDVDHVGGRDRCENLTLDHGTDLARNVGALGSDGTKGIRHGGSERPGSCPGARDVESMAPRVEGATFLCSGRSGEAGDDCGSGENGTNGYQSSPRRVCGWPCRFASNRSLAQRDNVDINLSDRASVRQRTRLVSTYRRVVGHGFSDLVRVQAAPI